METKVCTKCGKELPANNEYFYKKSSMKDGLWSECKECWKTERNDLKNNREKANEYARTHHMKNRKTQKEWAVQYRQTEKGRKSCALYRENNIFKRKRYYHFYRTSSQGKEYFKNYSIKRKSTIDSLEFSFTKEQWEECKSYFDNKCCYCGKELPLSQDHFIPLSKGGEYTHNNIIPACKSCNSSKGNRDFYIWYPKSRYYSKKRERNISKFLGYTVQGQQLSLI